MIDLATETVVTLTDAPRHLPSRRRGRKPHSSTLFRWAKYGVKAADGAVIKLETIRVGGSTCTSVQSLQRFCEALTARTAPEPKSVRTPSARRKAIEMQQQRAASDRGAGRSKCKYCGSATPIDNAARRFTTGMLTT